MNELFFHECRAAGLVFKTSNDWLKWLTDNGYDIKKPVAEHEGFKYNINDVCARVFCRGCRQLGIEGNDRKKPVRLGMGLQHSEWKAWIRQSGRLLEKNAGTKNTNLLLWAAKKKADIIHPQQKLFQ